jgi:hypothetical protein
VAESRETCGDHQPDVAAANDGDARRRHRRAPDSSFWRTAAPPLCARSTSRPSKSTSAPQRPRRAGGFPASTPWRPPAALRRGKNR